MSKPALLVLAIAFSALIVQGQTPRPCQPPALQTTSQEPNIFTEQQEADLGDAIAEHIQRNLRVIDDEEVTGNLTRIGQRIIKHLPPTNLRFQFLLVDLPDANAFVLPGGRIYVNSNSAYFGERPSVQHLADLAHQCFSRKGLLEERRAFIEHAMVNDSSIRVARNVKHTHIRTQRGKMFSQVAAAHLRHHDISDEELDLVRRVAGDCAQSLRRIRCL